MFLIRLAIFVVIVVSSFQPIAAQEAQLLKLNEAVTGIIKPGNPANFTIRVPRRQDVIVAARSEGIIFIDRDVTAITAGGDIIELDYDPRGGGSSDSPTSIEILIPAFVPPADNHPDPMNERRIDISIIRPSSFLTAVDYSLTIYLVDPTRLRNQDLLSVEPIAGVPEIFTIESPLSQPLTVVAQVDNTDRTYLWTSNIPRYGGSITDLPESDTSLVDPVSIDSAANDLTSIRLYYAGMDTFYLIIRSEVPYTLTTTTLTYETLAESETHTLTISPQMPIRLLRIVEDEMPQVNIAFQIVDGAGARITAEEDGDMPGSYRYLVLGETGRNNAIFSLDGMLSVPVDNNGQITVVVHVPSNSIGGLPFFDPVNLKVRWTASQNDN